MQTVKTEKRREKNRGPKTDLSGSSYMKNLLAGIAAIRAAAVQPKPTTGENKP